MGADEKIGLIFIALGFIGFPLTCWLLYLWADNYCGDEVAKHCRRVEKEYIKWERKQRRKRK